MAIKVVVLGALSAVALATARRYAAQGATFALAARNAEELAVAAADLSVRGAAAVETFVMDLADPASAKALPGMTQALGGADVIVLAYGGLTDQALAERDLDYAARQLALNFTSAALWSLAAADILEQQGRGVLVVIGSVAGDRGRGSNYVYGSAKAGLAALVQGVAHRLAATRARAVLVKPGFIDSPMTAHLPRGGPLWSTPDTVAAVIVRAAQAGGPVVYAPWFWRYILLLIRLTPAFVFHRTKL